MSAPSSWRAPQQAYPQQTYGASMTPQPTQHLRTMGTGRYPAGPPPPAPAVDLMASPQAQVPSAAAAPPDGTVYYPTFASEPRLKRSWSHRAAAPFTAGYGQMRRATTGWSLRRARSHTGPARPGPVPYLVAGYAQHALPAALEVHVSGGLRSKMFAMDRATGEVVFAWRRLEGLLEKVYEVLDLRTNARLALIKNDLGSHTFRVSDTHGVERLCLHRPLPWGEYQVSYPTPAGEATRLPLLYDAQHRTYWLTHPRASMAKIRLQNNTGQTVLDVLVEPNVDILLGVIVAFVCAKKEAHLGKSGGRPGGFLRTGISAPSTPNGAGTFVPV